MTALPAPLPADDLRRCIGPLEQARTLPAAAYLDPAVADWERRAFFAASWICVGRSEQLANPGDQSGVHVGDEPVLLTRDRAGTLRAFSNVCRHRGSELRPCDGSVANAQAVRCPYHRWTYGLDGAFKGGPDASLIPGFDRTDPDHGLVALDAAEWAGWMFVCCEPGAPPLADHLGNLVDVVAPYDPASLRVAAGHDYVIAANWKLVVENYSECYHCPEIHPELCRVSPPGSGRDLESTGRWIGGPMRLADHAETVSLDGRSGGSMLRGLSADQRREVLYLALFPNLLLSLHPDYVLTHRLEPLGPGSTRIECQWLFPQPVPDPSYAVDFWDLTNRQDWAACEGVQRGVSGRGYRQAPFAASEVDVAAFVAYVAQAYLSGSPATVTPEVAARR